MKSQTPRLSPLVRELTIKAKKTTLWSRLKKHLGSTIGKEKETSFRPYSLLHRPGPFDFDRLHAFGPSRAGSYGSFPDLVAGPFEDPTGTVRISISNNLIQDVPVAAPSRLSSSWNLSDLAFVFLLSRNRHTLYSIHTMTQLVESGAPRLYSWRARGLAFAKMYDTVLAMAASVN